MFDPYPHRTVYEEHYGPIPKESNGRTYEIHHINGDHYDNRPENLVALTKAEHRSLHNMNDGVFPVWETEESKNTRFTPERARDLILKKVEDGTHPAYSPINHMKIDHPSTHGYLCNHCGFIGSKVTFTRWRKDCKPYVNFTERFI